MMTFLDITYITYTLRFLTMLTQDGMMNRAIVTYIHYQYDVVHQYIAMIVTYPYMSIPVIVRVIPKIRYWGHGIRGIFATLIHRPSRIYILAIV
ncbi:MAG: hypothetical protein ACOYEN_09320 [Limnochordia bacterium]